MSDNATLLAIDPGNVQSAWVMIDVETCKPKSFAKEDNDIVLERLDNIADSAHPPAFGYVEMIASYGMGVGKTVFDTCVWIGRFTETYRRSTGDLLVPVERVPIKTWHCHSARAKDSNVRLALIDRFAPGTSNYGRGTKADPGWFYGFKADIWQAYAVAVYAADLMAAQGPEC